MDPQIDPKFRHESQTQLCVWCSAEAIKCNVLYVFRFRNGNSRRHLFWIVVATFEYFLTNQRQRPIRFPIEGLQLNKAGNTATPVACGWAGAVLEATYHLGRSHEAKDSKNSKNIKCEGRTDRPTNGTTE